MLLGNVLSIVSITLTELSDLIESGETGSGFPKITAENNNCIAISKFNFLIIFIVC